MTKFIHPSVTALAEEILQDFGYTSQKNINSLSLSFQQSLDDWLEDYEGMLAEPPYDTHEEKAGLR